MKRMGELIPVCIVYVLLLGFFGLLSSFSSHIVNMVSIISLPFSGNLW